MLVRRILVLIDDDTIVILRNKTRKTITRGHWYNDQILDHSEDPVETFTWYDDNTVHIDVKEV